MSTRSHRWSRALGAGLACLALQSQAVTQDNFLVRDTKDIIELCSVLPTDPLYVAATHFCQGYVVGAYRYQESFYNGPEFSPLVCPPEPKPSRNQAIAQFIAWAKTHPEYGKEPAVDTLMRYLVEHWRCKD